MKTCMPDVLAIAALVAFFAIAVVFVHACERIIGPDLESEASADATESQRTHNGGPDKSGPDKSEVAA
jgi:hypothetical protein